MAERKQMDIVNTECVFPDYYPKNVPPKTALDANGVFYRLVKHNPPTPKCFDNMYLADPNRLKRYKGVKLTYCYGTSLYTDESSLDNAFNKFPEGVGDRFVAKGELSPCDGKMLKTGAPDTTHYTVWLVDNHKVHKHFSCIRGLSK